MADQVLNGMAAGYCSQLKSFVTCLHSNTSQLKASISQKPPAYGDLSSFLLDFNDRAAEDAAQLGLLEEMTVENVSFEELLAHCMELYKQNETGISLLESQLEQFGYSKGGESVIVGEGKHSLEVSFVEDLKQRVRAKESSPRGSTEYSREDLVTIQNAEGLSSSNSSGRSYAHFETIRSSASRGRLQLGALQSPLPSTVANSKLDIDDMAMLGESLSLEDFGISASSLASLARIDPLTPEKDGTIEQKNDVTPAEELSENGSHDMDESCSSSPRNSPPCQGIDQCVGTKPQSSLPLLGLVMEEEYAQLSPWLKQRVPLEELNVSIIKINDAFHVKESQMVEGTKVDGMPLELEDSFLLGLGSNMKACLLLLVQIDRLVIARHNGRAFYRPSELTKFR